MRSTRKKWNNRTVKIAVVLVALLIVFVNRPVDTAAAPGDGTSPTPGVTPPKLAPVDTTLMPVDYKMKPIVEIALDLSRKSGKNIVVQAGIFERVTLAMPNPVPWNQVLEMVVNQIGCEVRTNKDGTLLIVRKKKVQFHVVDEDIKTVLFGIAKTSGKNIVVEGDVVGKVTLNLDDVSWKSALYAVARSGGYVVVAEDAGTSGQKIYRVTSAKRLKAQLERKLFRVQYLRPPEEYQAMIEASGVKENRSDKNRAATKPGSKTGTRSPFPLEDALRSMLSENGTLKFEQVSNSFLVTDIKPVLDAIEKILKDLDVEPVQISVEVKFVLTSNTDLFAAGVNWKNGFTAALSGGSTASRFPFNLGSFGLQGLQIHRSGPNAADDAFARDPDQDGKFTSGPFSPGLLDFTQLTLLLQLIKSDVQSEIVQEPRLLTLDHKRATIFVGETIHYAETEAAASDSGGLTFSLREALNSPVQTGFQLFVLPHVIPGTNRVQMQVIPIARTLTGTTSTAVVGFAKFTAKADESGQQELTIDLPQIQNQSLVTNMMLESGQTAVIGGLITSRETHSVTKVPFLGDIPILGWIFRSESSNVTKQNLLIFVTPVIIRHPGKELPPIYEAYLKEQQKLFPWKYKKTEAEKREAGRWTTGSFPKEEAKKADSPDASK